MPLPILASVHFRDRNQVFSGLLIFVGLLRFSVEANGQPEVALGQPVSGNYYSVLGIKAIVGRTLTAEDDRIPAGHPVAVISYGRLDHSATVGCPISSK